MLKLTRLNHNTIAINPDHISWVEATPDTTLFLINGEKLMVRETLDELMNAVIMYRRLVRMVDPAGEPMGPVEGDPPRVGEAATTRKPSEFPRRASEIPHRRDDR
jgi:flagellar protein FlbD